jgi:hypothetical protein
MACVANSITPPFVRPVPVAPARQRPLASRRRVRIRPRLEEGETEPTRPTIAPGRHRATDGAGDRTLRERAPVGAAASEAPGELWRCESAPPLTVLRGPSSRFQSRQGAGGRGGRGPARPVTPWFVVPRQSRSGAASCPLLSGWSCTGGSRSGRETEDGLERQGRLARADGGDLARSPAVDSSPCRRRSVGKVGTGVRALRDEPVPVRRHGPARRHHASRATPVSSRAPTGRRYDPTWIS